MKEHHIENSSACLDVGATSMKQFLSRKRVKIDFKTIEIWTFYNDLLFNPDYRYQLSLVWAAWATTIVYFSKILSKEKMKFVE